MAGGRPNKGSELVNSLNGDEESKLRLKVILETIAGKITVIEACDKLNICESRFHKIRSEILQNSLDLLQPKPKGRPSLEYDEKTEKIKELTKELRETKLENKVLQVKSELAVLAPHLLNNNGTFNEKELEQLLDSEKGLKKKKKKKKEQQKRSRRKNR